MNKLTKFKLISSFIYACFSGALLMFFLTLFFKWIFSSDTMIGFFDEKNLQLAFKMGLIGFVLGVGMWLSYYIPYRKNLS